MSFVVWSLSQDMELVGTDYYDQEMRYQQRIDSVKRTQALAGHVVLRYEAGRLTLTLPAAAANPRPVGTVHFYRPSDAKLDRETKLAVNAAGTQDIAVPDLRPGLWKARVAWTVGADEFFHDETFIVPSARARAARDGQRHGGCGLHGVVRPRHRAVDARPRAALPVSLRFKLQRLVPLSLAVVGTLLILRGLALGIPCLSPDLAAGTCAHCH